ncbi:MAG: hypothetical protein VB878_18760 [Pirellulaceae bacterium]
MMNPRSLTCLAAILVVVASATAADYRVEKGKESIPAGVSPAIAKQLAPASLTVIRGTSRTILHVWLCKEWQLTAFEAKGDVNYPFQPGQLMGLMQVVRKHSDFRDQDIADGVYTLRYGHQPVDGAHIGTSPTRDFVLLISAKVDKSVKPIGYEDLVSASGEVAGTNHPALFSLQQVRGGGPIRHDEDRDWWIARLTGTGKVKDKSKSLALDLVVYGQGE